MRQRVLRRGLHRTAQDGGQLGLVGAMGGAQLQQQLVGLDIARLLPDGGLQPGAGFVGVVFGVINDRQHADGREEVGIDLQRLLHGLACAGLVALLQQGAPAQEGWHHVGGALFLQRVYGLERLVDLALLQQGVDQRHIRDHTLIRRSDTLRAKQPRWQPVGSQRGAMHEALRRAAGCVGRLTRGVAGSGYRQGSCKRGRKKNNAGRDSHHFSFSRKFFCTGVLASLPSSMSSTADIGMNPAEPAR